MKRMGGPVPRVREWRGGGEGATVLDCMVERDVEVSGRAGA